MRKIFLWSVFAFLMAIPGVVIGSEQDFEKNLVADVPLEKQIETLSQEINALTISMRTMETEQSDIIATLQTLSGNTSALTDEDQKNISEKRDLLFQKSKELVKQWEQSQEKVKNKQERLAQLKLELEQLSISRIVYTRNTSVLTQELTCSVQAIEPSISTQRNFIGKDNKQPLEENYAELIIDNKDREDEKQDLIKCVLIKKQIEQLSSDIVHLNSNQQALVIKFRDTSREYNTLNKKIKEFCNSNNNPKEILNLSQMKTKRAKLKKEKKLINNELQLCIKMRVNKEIERYNLLTPLIHIIVKSNNIQQSQKEQQTKEKTSAESMRPLDHSLKDIYNWTAITKKLLGLCGSRMFFGVGHVGLAQYTINSGDRQSFKTTQQSFVEDLLN